MNVKRNMTPRLLAIADCVRAGNRLADIGTDHAYIPIYLLQQGIIPSAVAMDIKPGPIERAQSNINKFQLQDKIATRLSDGLKKLEPGETDEIVIAGMGGILICEILEARRDLWSENLRFILQPMTAAEELRRYLEKNGFLIESETLAKEGRKLYQIICAKRGLMKMEKESDYYIGPYLISQRVPWTEELIHLRILEYEKMLSGLLCCKREGAAEKREYVKRLLNEFYKMRKEYGIW